jgi:hypothetical protein
MTTDCVGFDVKTNFKWTRIEETDFSEVKHLLSNLFLLIGPITDDFGRLRMEWSRLDDQFSVSQ